MGRTSGVIKGLLELLGVAAVLFGLIIATYTILGTTFSELYNLDDRLISDLQSNDKLNKIYIDVNDPHKKINIMASVNNKNNKHIKWDTIHELRNKMFNPKYYDDTKYLREAYNFCSRINMLNERIYYTFNPPSNFIASLYRYMVRFNLDKYGGGDYWIKSWIKDICDHPIYLIAFDDYVNNGGVEYDLCVKSKNLICEAIKKKGTTEEVKKMFPELLDSNRDYCRK